VLGLGERGLAAGLPAMEGKTLLFKFLGGVNAVSIVLREKDPDRSAYIVKVLESSFEATNLAGYRAPPKCFCIPEKLQEVLNIPVWYDDQQGTALVNVTVSVNALKVVGKRVD